MTREELIELARQLDDILVIKNPSVIEDDLYFELESELPSVTEINGVAVRAMECGKMMIEAAGKLLAAIAEYNGGPSA